MSKLVINSAGTRRRARAFTLTEMLVALAVLTLMIVFISQLTNNASRTVISAGKQSDADIQARVVFNRLAADFARMVKRADADSDFKQPAGALPARYGGAAKLEDLQPGNDRLAFYSETVGWFADRAALPAGADKAPLSLVAYQVADDPFASTPVLRRMGLGLCWNPTGGFDSPVFLPVTLRDKWGDLFTVSDRFKTIGDQIFRFEYAYLLKPADGEPSKISITPWRAGLTPAHTSADGFRDVAAIIVTVAILDNTSRKITANYDRLTAALTDAADDVALAGRWNEIINRPGFAESTGVPKPAAAFVKVYERYFYLDNR